MYLWGADGLIGTQSRDSQNVVRSSYFLYDAQGNLAQSVDGEGNVTPAASYTAWGEVVPRADGVVPGVGTFGYGAKFGYLRDGETGFYLCTYRHYDPSAGRWITRDPIGYAGGSNLYGYVQNDPANLTDPSGKIFVPLAVAIIAAWFYIDARQNPANTPMSPTAPIYYWGEVPVATDPMGQDAMTHAIPLRPTLYGPTWRNRHPIERRSLQEHEACHRRRAAIDMWLSPFAPLFPSWREAPAYRYEKWWNEQQLNNLPKGHPDRKYYERNLRDINYFLRNPNEM